jgi:hypothetical protein
MVKNVVIKVAARLLISLLTIPAQAEELVR